MVSPYEAVLRDRAAKLIEQLALMHIAVAVSETSWREYHVKLNLKEAGRPVGEISLYYAPSKKTFSLVERELKDASVQRLARQAFEKGEAVSPTRTARPAAMPVEAGKALVAYVDGSFINGRVGYGALILRDGVQVVELYGRVTEHTDSHQVAGELVATMKVITYCEQHQIDAVQIVYDYAGIEKWARKQWKANLPLTQHYQDFMQQTRVRVCFSKVQSHTGNALNDAADALARKGALEG